MKVETKLNLLDEIYFIIDKKVINSIIRGIKIDVRSSGAEIIYLCAKEEEDNRVYIKCEENYAFKSKAELLKSL